MQISRYFLQMNKLSKTVAISPGRLRSAALIQELVLQMLLERTEELEAPAAATRWTATASSRPLPDGHRQLTARHDVAAAACLPVPVRSRFPDAWCGHPLGARDSTGASSMALGAASSGRRGAAGAGGGVGVRRQPPRSGRERGRRCWGVTRGGPEGRGRRGLTRGGPGGGAGEVARERRPAGAQLGVRKRPR